MASLRVRQRKDGSSYTAVLYTLDGKQTSSSFNDHREAVAFQQLVNRVGPAKALERHRDRWEEGFSRLMQYVERHGDARIPRSYKVDGYRLGGWVSNLRSFYSRGTLGADRRRQLEDLPGWTFDTVADRWEEGFTRLVQYVERHGDARVPQSYEIDGYRLGSWVTMQRTRHAKGVLDADRERRLQNLRGWTWNPKGDQWEEGFCRLVDYVRCHGDARVPWTVEVDGYPLGKWVREQRNRHSKGILDADRRHRLEGLTGWSWHAYADRWEDGFIRLERYVERHRDARVPMSYRDDGYPLGAWVVSQRQFHRKGTLDADRECRLERLTGWTWNAKADQVKADQ